MFTYRDIMVRNQLTSISFALASCIFYLLMVFSYWFLVVFEAGLVIVRKLFVCSVHAARQKLKNGLKSL